MDEQLSFWSEETVDHQPDKTTNTEWKAVRDDCISGGALIDACNLIAAAHGTGRMEIIAKKLACGCLLIPIDSDEIPFI